MEELFIFNNSSLPVTSPTNLTQVELSRSPAEVTTAVLLGLCCALGIPGNVAVLVLLLRRLEKNNFTQLLMLNLACCDLLCLMTVPVGIVDLLRPWDVSNGLCKFISFLVFCSLYANIFTITLMSVQRFVSVLHHRSWARIGKKGERALLVGLWGVSCLVTWPSVASMGRIKNGHPVCSRPVELEGQNLTATVVELVLGFIVPFSVMSSFYICLYRKVKETALSSNKRTSQLISRIIITFVVLWVPSHIVSVVGLVGTSLRTSQPDVASKLLRFTDDARVVDGLPLFSAIIDPFLYAFSFRKIWPRNRESEDVLQSSGGRSTQSKSNNTSADIL